MKKQNQFEELFSDAFDTFNVFHKLSPAETGRTLPAVPKTIWQILHHLIIWQDHQLTQLQENNKEIEIDELLTWTEEEHCDSQERLNNALAIFEIQLERLREAPAKFDIKDHDLQRKLKVVQDLSVHLAFHLGEIILMRRMTGNYPIPHQMKEFLK